MTQEKGVKINPDVLKWAIKESGKSEFEIINKFPKIDNWIIEEDLPTFKKIEDLSNFFKIPLGYFFLSEPPKSFKFKADFRSINNVFPKASKNLKETIIDMSQRQNWLIEYREKLGYEDLEINRKFNELYQQHMNYMEVAKIIVDLIDLDYAKVESFKTINEYYNYFRNMLEQLGISVFQNGVVGNNTHRKLDLEEFRAFVLIDKIAPIIFINSCDSQSGKVFSIVHEFVHILLGEDDIITEEDNITKNERYINNITAEILAPKCYLLSFWNKEIDYINQISILSKKLKISQEAIALKLLNMSLINQNKYEHIKSITTLNVGKKNNSGGNYYNNLNSKLSENFKRDVIYNIESNNISYTEGFRLLGNIKAKAYGNLKEITYGI